MGKRFSVVTLTYAHFNHLKETVLSVCAQDYDDIEYIICDDGSKNFPEDHIIKWIEDNKGPNLKQYMVLRHEENVGTVRNINYAYSHASGDYFINLSCGDVFFEKCTISKIADRMKSDKAKMMVTSRLLYKGGFTPLGLVPHYSEREKLRRMITKEDQYKSHMKNGMYGMASGCVLCSSRAIMEELGYFDERYVLLEDGPLLAKYLKKYPLNYYPEMISIWYEQGGVSTGGIKELSHVLKKDYLLFSQNEGIRSQKPQTNYEKQTELFLKARREAKTIRKKILCYLRYPIPAISFLEYKLEDRSKRIIDKPVIKRVLAERGQAAVDGC